MSAIHERPRSSQLASRRHLGALALALGLLGLTVVVLGQFVQPGSSVSAADQQGQHPVHVVAVDPADGALAKAAAALPLYGLAQVGPMALPHTIGANTRVVVLTPGSLRTTSASVLQAVYDRGGVIVVLGMSADEVHATIPLTFRQRGSYGLPPPLPRSGETPYSVFTTICGFDRSGTGSYGDTGYVAGYLFKLELDAGGQFNRICGNRVVLPVQPT